MALGHCGHGTGPQWGRVPSRGGRGRPASCRAPCRRRAAAGARRAERRYTAAAAAYYAMPWKEADACVGREIEACACVSRTRDPRARARVRACRTCECACVRACVRALRCVSASAHACVCVCVRCAACVRVRMRACVHAVRASALRYRSSSAASMNVRSCRWKKSRTCPRRPAAAAAAAAAAVAAAAGVCARVYVCVVTRVRVRVCARAWARWHASVCVCSHVDALVLRVLRRAQTDSAHERTYQRAESDAVGLEPAQQVLLDLRDGRQQREVDRRLDLLRERARIAQPRGSFGVGEGTRAEGAPRAGRAAAASQQQRSSSAAAAQQQRSSSAAAAQQQRSSSAAAAAQQQRSAGDGKGMAREGRSTHKSGGARRP
jgi:hypothetical protein